MNGSLTLCLEVIFWFALFVVFYTYLGYGIVLYILVYCCPLKLFEPKN